MTGLLTNASASVALHTLRLIGRDLDATAQRVATGLRVSSASDGAAYWAIATTLRADNGSLDALTDVIGFDRTVLDTTSFGLGKVLEQLNVMSATLVSAMGGQVDPAKLQHSLASAQGLIRTIGDSTVVNGTNWLSVDTGSAGFTARKDLVIGLSRQIAGTALGTMALDTSGFILFDAKPREGDGSEFSPVPAAGSLAASLREIARTASTPSPGGYQLQTWDGVSHRGGQTLCLTWNYGFMDTRYYVQDGPQAKQPFSIASIDLSSGGADKSMILAYAKVVDATRQKLLDGAARLGATSVMLGAQQDFARHLMAINASAIGTLVDADIEADSIRLKALQTQQQLGLQTLNVANSASQNVLRAPNRTV
ncbi:flagellin N-terminal helical domain-containing protein [Methylobacterium sp. Leaf106]|uniref:flagellin N-terminal helical domain-containing protein n=1 Tax=Methylobacterium sp. Leaf106 TaxID=1736255 RepID=UPI0006FA87BB|nr:flagellin [Methylobacterium sp. Leaf106]KQP43562.1 hypothetical protein ASF34_21720 [Methylobacterium sp. Leaf106]